VPTFDAHPPWPDQEAGGPLSACSAQAKETQRLLDTMVRCSLLAGAINQCNASALCNSPSWHLCTRDDYLGRGGSTGGPDADAWIASCIRDGASVQAASNSTCSDCRNQSTVGNLLSVRCGVDAGNFMAQMYVGVLASTSCNAIGQSRLQGYWRTAWAGYSVDSAMCCQ
jgi:hypothetical protein